MFVRTCISWNLQSNPFPTASVTKREKNYTTTQNKSKECENERSSHTMTVLVTEI